METVEAPMVSVDSSARRPLRSGDGVPRVTRGRPVRTAGQRHPVRLEFPRDRLAFDLERDHTPAKVNPLGPVTLSRSAAKLHVRGTPCLGARLALPAASAGYSRAALGRLPVAMYVVPGP